MVSIYSALCQSAWAPKATISWPISIINPTFFRFGKFYKKIGKSQNCWEKLREFQDFWWEIGPDPSSNTENKIKAKENERVNLVKIQKDCE